MRESQSREGWHEAAQVHSQRHRLHHRRDRQTWDHVVENSECQCVMNRMHLESREPWVMAVDRFEKLFARVFVTWLVPWKATVAWCDFSATLNEVINNTSEREWRYSYLMITLSRVLATRHPAADMIDMCCKIHRSGLSLFLTWQVIQQPWSHTILVRFGKFFISNFVGFYRAVFWMKDQGTSHVLERIVVLRREDMIAV
jgi:hypothetical protein